MESLSRVRWSPSLMIANSFYHDQHYDQSGQQWSTMVNNVQQWLTMVKSNLNDVLQTPGPVFSNRGWESRLSCEQRCKWRREWYLKSWYVMRWYFKSCFCEGLQHRGHPWGNEAGRCARRSSESDSSLLHLSIWAAVSQSDLSLTFEQPVRLSAWNHLSSQSDCQHGKMPRCGSRDADVKPITHKYVFKVNQICVQGERVGWWRGAPLWRSRHRGDN